MAKEKKLAKAILDNMMKRIEKQSAYHEAIQDLIIFGTTNPIELTQDGELIYESIWGKNLKKVIPVEVDDETK